MQKSFKEQKDGSFELLLDDKNSGIFFHIPPKCKIEDYNIVIVGQKLVSSSRAHFTLDNPPKNMGLIKINSEADIHFENNINITVSKSLEIGRNNNLITCDKIQMNKTSSSDSQIKIIARNSSEAETKTKIPICLENIKLDSKACLEVNVKGDLNKEVNIPIEFKNTDFNQYNAFEIGGALSVENSFFKNLRFISSFDNKESIQKIDNSMCKDIVRLHNISKLSFSEINNTDISSNKEVEVNNEFIKDQRIGDYEEFAKSRQAGANFDRDTRITEDLEIL